jgi:hypothetical protein
LGVFGTEGDDPFPAWGNIWEIFLIRLPVPPTALRGERDRLARSLKGIFLAFFCPLDAKERALAANRKDAYLP